jgi:replicative DNA helicase
LEEVYKLVGVNALYYQDQASTFARSQAVSGAVRAAIPLIEQGDIEEVGRMVSDALKIGAGADSSGLYDYFGMAPERIRYYLNGHSKEDRLATGLTSLDDCMGGGLGKGELGTIVSLPKFGKTTTLVNFGARALLQNKRVVYFTLELSKKMIASKFDNALFGRTLEKIKDAPREFAMALKEMRDRLTGKLIIAEFPTKGLTVDRMSTVVSKIGNVDLILVDYGQLVKAITKRDQRRHELSEVYEGMRRMAGELQIPVWTAHQANRPGTHSKVILPEHIAEDFNVIAISDIALSINHNEEEQRQGTMRLYIMGSRIGPSGMQIDCKVNWKTVRITLT